MPSWQEDSSLRILIAHKTLPYLNSKRTGKMGLMAVKLDMSKAYDHVEWVFLEKIMEKMGWSRRWILLISMCIRSVSYLILLNGRPHGFILPKRGLRQGDRLSPYLFLLVTKGLHGLLKKAEAEGSIRGVSLCQAGPRISHLHFVTIASFSVKPLFLNARGPEDSINPSALWASIEREY